MPRTTTVLTAILLLAAPLVAQPETVRFRTEDGLELEADLFACGVRGAAGVVAFHMYRSDRSAWHPLVDAFGRAGIDFLTVDLRGHGGSRLQEGEDLAERVAARDPSLFNAMHADALAAWRFLTKRGTDPDRVGFLGASVGCSVAIAAAAREERIRGALLMTPGTDYLGVPTLEHLATWWDRPLRILTSAEEADRGSRQIAAAVRSADLRVIEDRKDIHGTRMLGRVSGVEDDIVIFFRRLLGAPVAVDGSLSQAEAQGDGSTRTFRLADLEARLQSRGGWLHVVVTRKEGALPDRFLVAVAPHRAPDEARAVAAVRSAEGLHAEHLLFRGGTWLPVRRKPVGGAARLRLARKDVLEMLIPTDRTSWFPVDAHLKVAFASGDGRDGPWTALSETSPARLENWLAWPGK